MTFFVADATFGDVGESLSTACGQISGRAPEREMLYFSMQDALVVLCSTE